LECSEQIQPKPSKAQARQKTSSNSVAVTERSLNCDSESTLDMASETYETPSKSNESSEDLSRQMYARSAAQIFCNGFNRPSQTLNPKDTLVVPDPSVKVILKDIQTL
jgi:hypothetical protein